MTHVTLLNEQAVTLAAFPEYDRVFVRHRPLFALGVTLPHIHVDALFTCVFYLRPIIPLGVTAMQDRRSTGGETTPQTAHQGRFRPLNLTSASFPTELPHPFDNV